MNLNYQPIQLFILSPRAKVLMGQDTKVSEEPIKNDFIMMMIL
jgi:hypothetical protein